MKENRCYRALKIFWTFINKKYAQGSLKLKNILNPSRNGSITPVEETEQIFVMRKK